jgi:hypothetical protein
VEMPQLQSRKERTLSSESSGKWSEYINENLSNLLTHIYNPKVNRGALDFIASGLRCQ